MSAFSHEVERELVRARDKHPPIRTMHEGYAVILEELDEFWEHVRGQTGKRNIKAAYRELVQIAAMCERTAEDIMDDEADAPPASEPKQGPILCPHCDSPLLWSDDRGPHCDGCDDFDPSADTPSAAPPPKPRRMKANRLRQRDSTHFAEFHWAEHDELPACSSHDPKCEPVDAPGEGWK